MPHARHARGPMSVDSIRRALFGAIACAPVIHAGCKEPAPEVPGVVLLPSAAPNAVPKAAIEPIVSASATATATTPIVPSATASVAVLPIPPEPVTTAEPPIPKPAGCTQTKAYCLAPRTRPPSFGKVPSLPPGAHDPTAYDKNGCAARSSIPTSCSGMVLVSGPAVRKGQCCYDVCQGPVPPCGRPFVIEGSARVSIPTARRGWAKESAPAEVPLSPEARARLRDAWLADAAMEHASVASFSRLSLELLALGAPSDLVRDAHLAALEEVEHARACYGLASRFAKPNEGATPFGPSSLSLEGMTLATTFEELVRGAAKEGCVGETYAALAASRALEGCEDRATRTVLETIARDELSHATFAFRVLVWAIAEGGDAARDHAANAYQLARQELLAERTATAACQGSLGAYGRLADGDLAAIARVTVADILDPAMEKLLHTPALGFSAAERTP
jgi:hypothetical protein